MAKIKTYDYNRDENSLTVTYESGTVRKYTVSRCPVSTASFIMNDIIEGILSEYKQEFTDRKNEIFPLLRSGAENDIWRENSHLCSKLYYISELSSLSPIAFLNTLSRFYISLKICFSEAQSKDSVLHRRLDSHESDYNFISELFERFRFPADDDYFVFTLEHLLSVAFPEEEKPETSSAEKPDAVPMPEEEYEETSSRYPLETPDGLRLKSLCRLCRHLNECYSEHPSKVLEDAHHYERCDNSCGDCTYCCKRFEGFQRRYYSRE